MLFVSFFKFLIVDSGNSDIDVANNCDKETPAALEPDINYSNYYKYNNYVLSRIKMF